MKKAVMLVTFCCCFLFIFAGCNTADVSADLKVNDYFPITNNTRYVYQGQGNEYASYDLYNDYTSENMVQQRINNGGTVIAKVISISDGKLIENFSSGEAYMRENYLDKTEEAEVLLMEPIVKGTTWTLKEGNNRTITNTSVAVATPAGNYDAIEVTTEGANGTTTQYYAKDVGLIKTVFVSGETEISSTLSSIEKDVPLTQTIRFFYPNIDEDKIYYVDKNVDFHTNDITKDVIAATYKETPDGVGKVFSANTAINDLYLNDDGIVYLDLNQSFLTEMNAGSGYEAMILQSIANTFGYYYNNDKVILTVEGKLYSSGHLAFNPGEYLQTDLTKAVQLKS